MKQTLTERDGVANAEFVAFVRQHSDELHRLAYLLTGSRHDAEDVVQSAFIRLLQAWPRRDRWDNPDAYARRVVTTVFLTSVGRRSAAEIVRAALSDRTDVTATAAIGALDQRDELRGGLLKLTSRQRTAVVLRHYLDLSEADAARAMGCRVGTIKSLTARGLDVLRSHLKGEL